jgi:hypothetical protein
LDIERHDHPTLITQPHDKTSWRLQDYEKIVLNGFAVTEEYLLNQLASTSNQRYDIELINKNISKTFIFEFQIPEASELVEMERLLDETFPELNWELNKSSIDFFRERSSTLTSVKVLVSGICEFLRGIIARENQWDPGAESDSAKSDTNFNVALDKLKHYIGDTNIKSEVAEALSAVIAFEFNLFDRASVKKDTLRFASLANRLNKIVNNEFSKLDAVEATKWEKRFLDSHLSEIAELCSIPLDGTAHTGIAKLEEFVESGSYSKRDKIKLHLVAYAHYKITQNVESASNHLKPLERFPEYRVWAREAREKLGQSGS